ncbi:MAG: class I SAM-dependent methyltransferase [Nitrospirota bacterium]|jgi:SAM-dependent methyltransferase
MTTKSSEIKALATDSHYPAIQKFIEDIKPYGLTLDVPAGQGAFALELLKLGYDNIYCLDINSDDFKVSNPKVHFIQHDVINPLPFPDEYFANVFSIEGVEHFENPFIFIKELCRVLKPGGRLILTTPNTFSVDARLKYLLSGYFPRFKPLMQEPLEVMKKSLDDAHISPIYFWQLNFFLLQGGVQITRISTNNLLYKSQWYKRITERLIARLIRNNIKKRSFPDMGITSETVLFGDCLILEGVKRKSI